LINRRHFSPNKAPPKTSDVEATKNPPGSRKDFLTRPMREAANIEGKSSPAKVFLHDVGGTERIKPILEELFGNRRRPSSFPFALS
jgi:hypothetical protein